MPKTPPPYHPQGQPPYHPQGQPPYNPQGQPHGLPSSGPPPYSQQQGDAYQQAYQEAYEKAYKEAQQAFLQSQAGTSQVQQLRDSGSQPPTSGVQPPHRRTHFKRRKKNMHSGLGCATFIVGFLLLGSLGLLFDLGEDKDAATSGPTRFISNTDSTIVREQVLPHAGKIWTIDDVPMAHLEHKNEYVSDPDGYLSIAQKQFADSFLYLLEHQQHTQSAFILVGHVKDKDTYRFAVDLGRKYGISTADEHKGVTVVIAVGDRKYTIATSQGVQGVLTDLQCNRIAQQFIIPNMKAGNTAAAVIRTAQALYYTMADGFPHLDGDSTTLQEYEDLARQGVVSQPPISRVAGTEELTPEEAHRAGAIGTIISLLLAALLYWIYKKKKKDELYYASGAYVGSYSDDYDYTDDDDYSSSSSYDYDSDGGSYGGDDSYDGGGSSGGW